MSLVINTENGREMYLAAGLDIGNGYVKGSIVNLRRRSAHNRRYAFLRERHYASAELETRKRRNPENRR